MASSHNSPVYYQHINSTYYECQFHLLVIIHQDCIYCTSTSLITIIIRPDLDVDGVVFDVDNLVGDAHRLSRDALKFSLLVERRSDPCPERHFVVFVILSRQKYQHRYSGALISSVFGR